MTVDINTVVSLHYKLTNHKTGEKIEETSSDRPMEFLYGIERLIPKFEESVHGLTVGEKFNFSIVTEEAYGQRNDDQIAEIPTSVFFDESGKMNEEHIFVGAFVPMSDNEGNNLRGKVIAITEEHIKMDFNHPLAGIDLNFDGEITEVRKATDDEIAHGHSHGAHGHQH